MASRSNESPAASTYRRQATSLRAAALAGMPLFGTRRHGGIAAVEGLVDLVDALADENEALREQVNSGRAGREVAEGLPEGTLPRV